MEQSLKTAFPDRTYNICAVLAQGDKDKVTPLQQLSQGENAKSLWTGELEGMLEKGELSFIVHCLKGWFCDVSFICSHPDWTALACLRTWLTDHVLTKNKKDMPTQLPENLMLGAILEREDPRDALVISPRLPKTTTVATLPPGSVIGTSSVRRVAQLRRLYPHLKFDNLKSAQGRD